MDDIVHKVDDVKFAVKTNSRSIQSPLEEGKRVSFFQKHMSFYCSLSHEVVGYLSRTFFSLRVAKYPSLSTLQKRVYM